jgi:hypothetical protein
MTKTIAILTFVSALTFGAGAAHADDSAPTRGQVVVSGAAAKAVVVGPTTIHAYSAFSGGALYVVTAVSGTDADCRAQAEGGRTELRADKIVDFAVPAGQVACLAASAPRGVELLWHARKAPARTETLIARN